MPRAFIVRPFGTKEGIDFDRLEVELIAPALEAAGFAGGTTAEFTYQGNIRTDMFEQLLVADLVVADMSIHNANVFYELGIRHALRDRRTFLIKSKGDAVPFDLKTDRYFAYDAEDPGASVAGLSEALRRTWLSEDQDSPVFQLLPGLEPADESVFQIMPVDFQEEVGCAVAEGDRAKLALLVAETEGFDWREPALRLIAHGQRKIHDYSAARISWESVRAYDESDVEANTELGTIYQRLDDLVRSDQALGRALNSRETSSSDRAEIRALQGRNAKTRWEAEWRDLGDVAARQEAALVSRQLQESVESYRLGFQEDRNHYYSGLNALAMLTVQVELADARPDVWLEDFDDEDEAALRLRKLRALRERLAGGVQLALESRQAELTRTGETDLWVEISLADLTYLTSSRPDRVKREYREVAALAGFAGDSQRRQLRLYERLGFRPQHTTAALEALVMPEAKSEQVAAKPRVILFTGHRIDAEGRDPPRFPADREGLARDMIYEAVAREKELATGEVYGISGGASGGDILFHEVCAELEIPSRMCLVVPRHLYVAASVQDAGPEWVERFNRLYRAGSCQILAETDDLPGWLREKPKYSIWQRSNLWMLHTALGISEDNLTLIALWDGEAGDGPGGTEDMVHRAKARGAKFVRLDARDLIGEGGLAAEGDPPADEEAPAGDGPPREDESPGQDGAAD